MFRTYVPDHSMDWYEKETDTCVTAINNHNIDADALLETMRFATENRDVTPFFDELDNWFSDETHTSSCLDDPETDIMPFLRRLEVIGTELKTQLQYEKEKAEHDARTSFYYLVSGTAWPDIPLSEFTVLKSMSDIPESVNRIVRIGIGNEVPVSALEMDGYCRIESDQTLLDVEFDILVKMPDTGEWKYMIDQSPSAIPPMHDPFWNGCQPGWRKDSYPNLKRPDRNE